MSVTDWLWLAVIVLALVLWRTRTRLVALEEKHKRLKLATMKLPEARCPECGTLIDLSELINVSDGIDESELVTCPKCGADLEVAETLPVRFTVVEDDEEGEA